MDLGGVLELELGQDTAVAWGATVTRGNDGAGRGIVVALEWVTGVVAHGSREHRLAQWL